ncbi:origin recognition complex subunit 2 [Punctularia strigosozonata HHB-11173 SS5]|uniref:origin recognition complex subunit 2 n=1 Tax=Punctularia strigosozonata (strain HHB-11173) TaxID=741275 RepID=UPI0004418670|nr:origin recognition complex subunit 2 [Punctularia strigosozonata HHB-11173 SS5]EIN12680.1 origin recognition complex subunit 2 [Punctularia strigosozonata HHB-11173 SS5]
MSRSPQKRSSPRKTDQSRAEAAVDTPRRKTNRQVIPVHTPGYSEDESSSEVTSEDEDGEDVVSAVASSSRTLLDGSQSGLVSQTSFDAYFINTSKPSRTSSNVFSSILEPLSAEEYAKAMTNASNRLNVLDLTPLDSFHQANFPRYLRELHEGFNLLFYGFGSKRSLINKFAIIQCAKHGHLVVANAFSPNFTLRDFLGSIESVPGLTDLPAAAGQDGQAHRIITFFANTLNKPLYLIVHNVDAPALRSTKAKNFLSSIGLHPRIHIVATVDHVNAPLLWSSSEMYARKVPIKTDVPERRGTTLRRGYAWLWHDLTTLLPYDFELSFVDRSSISGASASAAGRGQQDTASGKTLISETAAEHILASVTEKAKKLFVMMGTKQLELIAEEQSTAPLTAQDLQKYAISYDSLFNAARDQFIATSDGALRALLGEFRDHGLVVSANLGGAGSREVLWIPMRKERLARIITSLKGAA